jgi:hypothetical protein
MSEFPTVDEALKKVASNKQTWATLPVQRKLEYLFEMKKLIEVYMGQCIFIL